MSVVNLARYRNAKEAKAKWQATPYLSADELAILVEYANEVRWLIRRFTMAGPFDKITAALQGHTTSGLDSAMQAQADQLHPVNPDTKIGSSPLGFVRPNAAPKPAAATAPRATQQKPVMGGDWDK